jgi:aminoglycoside phosphotransferase (APT) family kinase protein
VNNSLPSSLVSQVRLGQFLQHHLGERAELRVERLVAGRSNETFLVDWGSQRWILRRPPAGNLPHSAHDVLREYRVLKALQGSDVPVPGLITACADPSVIGAPFYLMERVDGFVITRSQPPGMEDPAARRSLGFLIVKALADLHRLDYREIGLSDLGRPEGFLRRQIERRFGQLESILSRTRDVPELRAVHEWLAANLPVDGGQATLIHGDFGPHNLLVTLEPLPKVLAILDWELATIGDPLTDIGWLTALWRDPGEEGWGAPEGFEVTELPGFPRKSELVQIYEDLSGTAVEHLAFYQVLALWRLAIALEGSYARYLEGHADNPYYRRVEKTVPAMARIALRIAARE